MRAVVQRVGACSVWVDGVCCADTGAGLLAYVGVAKGDGEQDAAYLADKVANLRVFSDAAGKMNLSVVETGGAVCLVSQFTLLGDARRGRRPSYESAEEPERARALYEAVCAAVESRGIRIGRGRFQEHMEVRYVNDGPITILLDSRRQF